MENDKNVTNAPKSSSIKKSALNNSKDAPLESSSFNSIHQNDVDLVQLIDPVLDENEETGEFIPGFCEIVSA